METKLETQNLIPKEVEDVETADTNSFAKVLEILECNDTRYEGIAVIGPIMLDKVEENSLGLLPEAFGLNRTIQKLWFESVKVDHILVAEALRAGIKKDTVTCIEFGACCIVTNKGLLETMCEGLQERSTAFELVLGHCSVEFVKPIIEASYSKCFSLCVADMDFSPDADSTGSSEIQRPLKNLLLKGSLYYIYLRDLTELKDDVFLQLGKCLLPKLVNLDLNGTEIPISALISLHGSLTILESGRSNMFEILDLGATEMGNKLLYAYFMLLRSDLVRKFNLQAKGNISREIVKHISSTVVNTKNLAEMSIGREFSSRTEFKSCTLQKHSDIFYSPFGVNPTVA